MKPLIHLITACMLFMFSCNQNSTSETNNIIEQEILEFEKQIKQDVENDNVGSISVTVFENNEIIWSQAFGMADVEKKIEADTNTIYRAASITKSVTAYLMMLFVQAGKIELDEPVLKYLPEISQIQHNETFHPSEITFRHLASHTSGLSREPELPDAGSGPFEIWEKKLFESIPTTRMQTVPGEIFSYSNIGYAILGLALSRVGNKPYSILVEEMIFKPMNMKSSFFKIPENMTDKVASGYEWGAFSGKIDSEKAKAEYLGRGYKVPNGGMYSTTGDLARFLMFQCVKNDLLSKEYTEKMQTIQTNVSKDYGYGLGYYIRKNDKGIKMIEHDGGVAGYNAFMVFNPEAKTGVVLMRNYNLGLTHILLEPRTLLSKLVKAKQNAGL